MTLDIAKQVNYAVMGYPYIDISKYNNYTILAYPYIDISKQVDYGLLRDDKLRVSKQVVYALLSSLAFKVTQMGTLVLAQGNDIPLTPSPLSLSDRGHEPVYIQRLVNMYVEPTPQGPSSSARFGRPGLEELAEHGNGPIRATFTFQDFRFTVSGGHVYMDGDEIASVPTAGPARFATSDEECVIVIGGKAYYAQINGDFDQITDPDLPDVRDVMFLNQRFIYIVDDTSGRYIWSGLNDARTIEGLAFASAESLPDPIVGGAVLGDSAVFFGTESTEWHYGTSDAAAPYQRSQGRRYDKGCPAIRSIVLIDNSLFWLGDDRKIYRSGQVPLRVSNYDIDNRIRKVSDADLPNVTSYGVSFGGHDFYVVNLPGEGTHALDIGQKQWAEWKTWGKTRFRVDFAENNFLGDLYTGKIMAFDGGLYKDLLDPLERICSTFLPLRAGMMYNFNLALHCIQGVGLAVGEDEYAREPVVEMRFSDRLGADWTNWMEAPLGAMGNRTKSALSTWTQLGSLPSPGRAFEFRCTDPVAFTPYAVVYNEKAL